MITNTKPIKPGSIERFELVTPDAFRHAWKFEAVRGSQLQLIEPAQGASDLDDHFVGQEADHIADRVAQTYLYHVPTDQRVNWPAFWLPEDARLSRVLVSWMFVGSVPKTWRVEHAKDLQAHANGEWKTIATYEQEQDVSQVLDFPDLLVATGGLVRLVTDSLDVFAVMQDVTLWGFTAKPQKTIAAIGTDVEVHDNGYCVMIQNITDRPLDIWVTYRP